MRRLALLLICVAPLSAAEEGRTVRDIAAEGAAAVEAGDWAGCERSYREAAALAAGRVRAEPDNLDARAVLDTLEYDAACCASRQGRVDAALELLSGVLDRGWYDDDGMLASDADLGEARKDPRFAALLARSRALLDAAAVGHADGMIVWPRGAAKDDRKAARVRTAIVALHGGGGNVETFAPAWQAVATRTGAAVILVRGRRVQGVGQFSYDQRRPAKDAERIEQWIAKARERAPGVADDEVFLAGFSQGGGMAWVLGAEGPRAWRGIVPIGGYVQVAVRERVLAAPAQELAAFALVGLEEDPEIRELTARLVGREAPRFRGHVEAIPGGHGLPADLPERIARALAWCRGGVARRGAADEGVTSRSR